MRITLFNFVEILIKKIKKNKKNEWYKSDYENFKRMSTNNHEFLILDNYPCLNDRDEDSGTTNGAYFHQDLFVAKQIYLNSPLKHVDIGSRIDGFIAHVAVFREIELFDIRNLESKVENIVFKQADLMSNDLNYFDYCDSISSLHALEHFGLGRYGDKIDPNGHIKGFKNITNILKKGGTFYFSVPMGIQQRIEFNAHRIFNLKYLINLISPDFIINSFSYIDDLGNFHENIQLSESLTNTSCGCDHGCAVFILSKK